MLFAAKIAEQKRFIDYMRRECVSLLGGAYPNLAARLQLVIIDLNNWESQASSLETALGRYRTASNPAVDIWKQTFKDLKTLSDDLQFLRVSELPSCLAATKNDHYMCNVVTALHQEVGLTSVNPVVALHQSGWFWVIPRLPKYPLYALPASIVTEPGETALIYHEIGHTLFRLWYPNFAEFTNGILLQACLRALSNAKLEPDPSMRVNRENAVHRWMSIAEYEKEELICDIVGSLLGGPAFTAAFTLGLLMNSSDPFIGFDSVHPPVDYRMHVGSIVLRRRGLNSPILDVAERGWAQVQSLYTPPIWYSWIYDDQYIQDMADAVEKYLVAQGIALYTPSAGGLRDDLDAGVSALFNQSSPLAYGIWAENFARKLHQAYDPA